MAFFTLSFSSFLAFLVVFFFFRAGIPCFFAFSPLFLPLFSSDGVKICDFWGVFPPFFCCQRLLFMDKRCFFLIFYGKKEKTGEFMLFFCVFFVFSRLLGLFSWCFLFVFFDFEGSGCFRVYFCAFFSFFGGIITFLSVLSLLRLLIFYRATKTAIFMQNNDEKQNIWKIVPVFSFSVFARAIFTWIFAFFAKIACKKYEHCYFHKIFFCFYCGNRLENLW